MVLMKRFHNLLLLAMVVLGPGPELATAAEVKVPKLPEQIESSGCRIFAKIVAAAGMVDTLHGPGPLTCFVPSDEAFAALPAGEVDRLLDPANRAEAIKFVSYLTVKGEATEEALMRARLIPTLTDKEVVIWVSKGVIKINKIGKIVRKDIRAENGVIHVLDTVVREPALIGERLK
jgi:uncharacterized surface protein with fasciclin (FAS1) repeats